MQTFAMIKPGIYKHYKGSRYLVINMVYHSETEQAMVLYRPMDGNSQLWVRPLDMFSESVVVEGLTVPRFSYVGNPGVEEMGLFDCTTT